ncbi:hypothetical protein [Nocardioides convexus]|nr:hypothetical protein [Nocardioides convexus]
MRRGRAHRAVLLRVLHRPRRRPHRGDGGGRLGDRDGHPGCRRGRRC